MQLQDVMNIYSYLTINPIYKNIITKYKININKGIAIHYRLGDKIQINLQKSKPMYVIMKPEYFIYHCQKMILEKSGPVYVFSDSIDIAKNFLKDLPDNTIYLDIGYIETFYLLTKRIKVESKIELLNKYYCAGNYSRDEGFETWSSSKIFAIANGGSRLRSNETNWSRIS
jgi:hypothetical protein